MKMFKSLMFSIFLIIFLGVALFGCKPEAQVIVKEKIIEVVPPAIHDTVHVSELDTVVIGQKIIEKDTVAIVKYFPKLKYIEYKVKPDTIRIKDVDTVLQTKKEIIETPFLSKIGILASGVIIGVFLIILIRFYLK